VFADLANFAGLIPEDPPELLADLDPRLRIFADDSLEVWYAPLGNPSPNPRLWILGITPGWHQMRIAYDGAAKALADCMPLNRVIN